MFSITTNSGCPFIILPLAVGTWGQLAHAWEGSWYPSHLGQVRNCPLSRRLWASCYYNAISGRQRASPAAFRHQRASLVVSRRQRASFVLLGCEQASAFRVASGHTLLLPLTGCCRQGGPSCPLLIYACYHKLHC